MLKEQAARWYLNGYNCAECIIHAANEQWQPLVQQMIADFERAAGARVCARIKPVQFDEQVRCLSTVNMAADILEQLIGERDETAALM